MRDLEQKKQKCDRYLDENMEELWGISKYIHENPEENFQEYKACKVQCDYLKKHGFEVEQGVGTLETAFCASYAGSVEKKPVIAIVSEYDALSIGHACGHNLIACSALGAAIEVKKYMEEEKIPGMLKVIGTPA